MKTIETMRLTLRKFKESDFNDVHAYAQHADNMIYMPWGPNDESQTRAFIARAIRASEAEPRLNWQYAAEDRITGVVIGGCDINIRGDEAAVGWIIRRDHWKKGYGTEMGMAMLGLAFDDLGLRRVEAVCDAENTASYRVMEKIGMRREGLVWDGRPAKKFSDKQFGDELRYAILRDEWEIQKEITYYNDLPCRFDGFIEVPELTDGVVRLVCTEKKPGIPEKAWVPAYEFIVTAGGEKAGEINLRIGYTAGLYYGGQIGYNTAEAYRGRGYAGRACELAAVVAKAHCMTKLIITNEHTNTASRRVCEKLGARFIRTARLPEWNDLYQEGNRYENIFEWGIE